MGLQEAFVWLTQGVHTKVKAFDPSAKCVEPIFWAHIAWGHMSPLLGLVLLCSPPTPPRPWLGPVGAGDYTSLPKELRLGPLLSSYPREWRRVGSPRS